MLGEELEGIVSETDALKHQLFEAQKLSSVGIEFLPSANRMARYALTSQTARMNASTRSSHHWVTHVSSHDDNE